MEVYILDSLYRRVAVLDTYQSLIWTERFTSWGDFELDISSSTTVKRLLRPGTLLNISDSYRVMVSETIEDLTDADGREILKVKGRSLEKILDDRLLMRRDEIDDSWIPWFSFGVPDDVMRTMFNSICLTAILNSDDVIPGVTIGSDIFPDDTIPSPDASLAYLVDPKTLYEGTKELADAFMVGFRLVRHPVTSALYYDVYTGCDRTTSQTTLPAVVFSPGLENLKNTRELSTSALFKNVAYVIYGALHEIVFALDVDPEVDGFDRHVLFVKIDSMDATDPEDITDQMIQAGKDELAKHRNLTSLDGEVAGTSSYRYGTDYNLGDLVELRDAEGTTSQMRVTEHIFASDEQGVRSYPTLTIEAFVTPGSWLSLPPTIEWEDYDTEHWDEMP
jgi:hypothetical protein